jgi:tetratricopeptide (TPR) repeat protein
MVRTLERKISSSCIPAALAMLTKEVSVVFPLLFLAYIILLEKKIPLSELFSAERRKDVWRALATALPPTVVCVGLLALCARMLPETYTPGNLTRLEYILAQPFVIVHYFNSFLLPFNLSADTDWKPVGNIFDDRVIVGAAFVALMAAAAVWSSRKDRTRPIAFGIVWFLIGVLPPSSGVVPLAEVMNDHRMFLPFIGLTMAASWSLVLMLERCGRFFHGHMVFRVAVVVLLLGVLAGHAYGTFQRNEVWKDEESLWLDVTQKSPGNPRGLMNYGLALMAKGDAREALNFFEKALLISPDYAHLHINCAIARNATGETVEAENHFKKAIACNPGYFGCYYYYARFLQQHHRLPESIPLLRKAIELSPGFSESRYLLMRIHTQQRDWGALSEIVENTLNLSPEDPVGRLYRKIVINAGDPVRVQELAVEIDPTPENYVWLSFAYCQNNEFEKCIEASREALKLKPDCVEAYNNICYAYVRLGEKAMAIAACERALAIDAHFGLARNNLQMALGIQ